MREMTPKEKADHIVMWMKGFIDRIKDKSATIDITAVECAGIAVAHVRAHHPLAPSDIDLNVTDKIRAASDYWKQVDIELEKMKV